MNFHAQLLEQEFSNCKKPLVRKVILLAVKQSHLHRTMTLINNDQAGMYSTKKYKQLIKANAFSQKQFTDCYQVIGKNLKAESDQQS